MGDLPPEVWTLGGVFLTAIATYFAARRQTASNIEDIRIKAVSEAVEIGSNLRDELRTELKSERSRRDDLEAKVHAVEVKLADTTGKLDIMRRLRCSRIDCPVFRGD